MIDERLRYLYHVVETGSMRAAGEKLGVAVSSISRQIAKIEREFRLPLLERGRRNIKLTEAGELALALYRERLAAEECFVQHIQDLRESRAGSVSIACGEAFLGSAFADFVLRCGAESPAASIQVKMAPTNEVIRYVTEDEMHMGLVLHVPADPKIRVCTSVLEPIKALMHSRHPLAGERAVTLRTLAGHALCLPERGFRLRQLIAQAEGQDGVSLKPQITTNSLALLKELVRAGSHVTLLPDIAAVNEITAGELVSVPITSQFLDKVSANLICRLGRQLPGMPGRTLQILAGALQAWARRANAIPRKTET